MSTLMELPEMTSRAQAEAYARAVCFRHSAPALIGAEVELLTERTDVPRARISLASLAAALGPHTPKSVDPDSPGQALPGGGLVTVEPGGQLEISSAPFESAGELCRALETDLRVLADLLTPHSMRVVFAAGDAHRWPELVMTTPRYRAGWDFWAQCGRGGQEWAANTTSNQVSVDAGGDPRAIAARWHALYTIGPALVAAFACSPVLRGMPPGGWASQRMRAVLQAQPARTLPPGHEWTDPIASYATWAMDVPLLCIRRDGGDWSAPPGASFADWMAGALDGEVERRPGIRDLEYHLTTLYPPVRPQGHLEVRYIDGQPAGLWSVPINAIAALTSSPEVVAEATLIAVATAGRWHDAARIALADPELRRAATALLDLAAEHAESPGGAAELWAAAQRCRAGLFPGRA